MNNASPDNKQFLLGNWIQRGDIAQWWQQGRHKFVFDPVAGRYIVLGFYRTASDATGQAALDEIHKRSHLVREEKICFFGISTDSKDKSERNVAARFPSINFLWDADSSLNRTYGVGASRMWVVLNPMLRVVAVIHFRPDGSDRSELFNLLDMLPPPAHFLGCEIRAPILVLSDVFEPELCRHLIALFKHHGGRESGFMEEIGGKAVESYDHRWKRRKDYMITDSRLVQDLQARIGRRIGPEVDKAYHFRATRIERHLVGCYCAEDAAHFGPHRDDTVKATAHRRFAVSINLNEDFDGGELYFPEYSAYRLKAPIGAAVIFSGSLLHSVSRVKRGSRYAYVPFLYDEEGEKIRQDNLRFLTQPTENTTINRPTGSK